MRRRFPLVGAIGFRSRGVIPLANQKLTFDERISCIVKYDDFSPRSHRAVSQQVTPFLVHCKGRGDRCRAGQMENDEKRMRLESSDSSSSQKGISMEKTSLV